MQSHFLYGAILSVSLLGAFLTWTEEPDPISGDEIELLSGKKDDLQEIEWNSPKNFVRISKKEKSNNESLWVFYKEEEKDIKKNFKASAAGSSLFSNYSPLTAIRKLESPSAEKLVEIGLQDPQTTVTVKRNDRTRILEIGNEAYGTKDLYVRDTNSGQVYLVDDEKFRTLKYAKTRLPNRSIWSFDTMYEIQKATLLTDTNAQIQFEHENNQDKQNARWNRSGTNTEEKEDSTTEQITTWMSKITGLRGGEYIDLDEKDLSFKFSLQIQIEDKKETLKIYTLKDDWYAHSSFSEGFMKLVTRNIEGLYSDIPSISNLE
jgi:hypothetical protein